MDKLQKHGKKTENGVGVDSVFIGKRRQCVECAVHQAVAVDDDKCFRHSALLQKDIYDYDNRNSGKYQ